MASLTLEQAAEAPKIRKQYRVRYREPDGTVCYESVNDTEGSELLFVHPDGSTFSEVIVGLCSPCAYGDGCGLGDGCPRVGSEAAAVHGPVFSVDPVPVVPDVGAVPAKWAGSEAALTGAGPDVAVVPEPKRFRLRRGKRDEPEPEPPAGADVPPVVNVVEESAREFAVMVWNSPVPLPRARFGPDHDDAITHAVAQGWVEVRGELVVRGLAENDPRPPEPAVSAHELRMRWGPGW